MPRRTARKPFKIEAEKTYLWRVDIDVPEHGFDHAKPHAWCRANVTEWAQHSYRRKVAGSVPVDVVRFYFADPFEAELFQGQFGGRLVKRSDAEGRMLISGDGQQGQNRIA